MTTASSTLSPLDAAFLYLETPTQPLHVGCIALLDGPVSYENVVTLFEERLLRFDRYRQCAVRPTLDLSLPAWRDASPFDIRRHVRHVAVPPPGDEAAFHELVDTLFATPLDPRLPLWESYLIDGLPGGASAILLKVHHCMIDGVSGAQVLEVLTDPDGPPVAAACQPMPIMPPPPARGPLSRLVRRLESVQPLEQIRRLRETVRSVGALLTAPASRLPCNGTLSGRRRIVWTSFAMEDVLAIRGATGCKVNDVVLSVVAGALRHYLAAQGADPNGLRVRALVPVSVRRASEHLTLGNLVAAMLPTLPVAISDPLARLRETHREMEELKTCGQAHASNLMMGLLGQLPAPVEVLLGRLLPVQSVINTVCTNVPGPAGTRRLLGRRVREVHPVVPLFEALGLEFAILSYGGRLSITAAADAGLVADAAALVPALEQSFHELRAAALATAEEEAPRTVSCVGELMTSPVVAISPNDSFAVAWQVMHGERIRHLPVVDDEMRLVGLVTHRDLLGHAPSDLEVARAPERFAMLDRVRVGDLMERHVSTATPQEPVAEAGRRMLGAKIGCLPVIAADGRLLGILTESDFVRWGSSDAPSTRAPSAVRA